MNTDCGKECWISPSQQRAFRQCSGCACSIPYRKEWETETANGLHMDFKGVKNKHGKYQSIQSVLIRQTVNNHPPHFPAAFSFPAAANTSWRFALHSTPLILSVEHITLLLTLVVPASFASSSSTLPSRSPSPCTLTAPHSLLQMHGLQRAHLVWYTRESVLPPVPRELTTTSWRQKRRELPSPRFPRKIACRCCGRQSNDKGANAMLRSTPTGSRSREGEGPAAAGGGYSSRWSPRC